MPNTSWDALSAYELQIMIQCYTKVDGLWPASREGGEQYRSELPHLFLEQTYLCVLQTKWNEFISVTFVNVDVYVFMCVHILHKYRHMKYRT